MPASSCTGFVELSGESTRVKYPSVALRAHVNACEDCAGTVPLFDDEVAALANGAERSGNQMSVYRVRRRLLQDVAISATGGRRVLDLRRRRALRGLLGATLGAMAVLVASSLSSEQPANFRAVVSTVGGEPATWSRTVAGGFERLNLADGTVEIRVRSHRAGETFVVQVPDGYLEDRGTTFEVVVRNGHTTRVTVVEGSVACNLLGIAQRILTAGERWERPTDAPLPEPVAQSKAQMPLAMAPPVVAPPGQAASPPHAARALAQAPRSARSRHPRFSPPRESFEAHPEDVAYLNIIRLLRASRRPDAVLAAHHYLDRFPQGFRADEMRALVERMANP